MPRPVSPAAAAGLSRILSNAGLKRAREVRKGIETEGYYAEPYGSHIRVDYTPGYYVEPKDALAVARPGLDRCKEILEAKGYNVTEVIEEQYVYGGHPPMEMPVLQVRKDEWTRSWND